MGTTLLVAFESPTQNDAADRDTGGVSPIEAAWDAWVADLRSHHLILLHDLDPVAVIGNIEVYDCCSEPL